MRLSSATLQNAHNVQRPGYDRNAVTSGIVHLGLGNFHRAHQAVYVDDILKSDPSWGITGVSLRKPDMLQALAPQDGLYTLAIKDEQGTTLRVIGSVREIQFAGDGPIAVLKKLAAPETRIVSLTVTEKGYCHDPATGNLDQHHLDIIADLANPSTPRSMPGIIAHALNVRRRAGLAPFTVMSCDNLPANGKTTKHVVTQFAALRDEALAQWIESNGAFPCSMVDRIVPATTEADKTENAELMGLEDAWPVVTEGFSQWVLEDQFACGRPDFGLTGVQLVTDVGPYENMKLRMLNGAHSTIAYFGQLLGLETVADAISDPDLCVFVTAMWRDEIIPILPMPESLLQDYAAALAKRFRNPALKHRTAQIAMDGSQKIPQRLLASIRDHQARGTDCPHLTTAVAAWMAYASGMNGRFTVNDPLATQFETIAQRTLPDVKSYAAALLDRSDIFGSLSAHQPFRANITSALTRIMEQGARATLKFKMDSK